MGAFTTATGLQGEWPELPDHWSHSTLNEAMTCPRRYALRRSDYDGVWDRSGYPDLVTEASVAGSVVHRGVEVVIKAFHDAGCSSLKDPAAIQVLRDLGGFSEVVEAALDIELAGLSTNPRMTRHLDNLRERLEQRIPQLRETLQVLTSRLSLIEPSVRPERAGLGEDGPERGRLDPGAHPEADLAVEDLRFKGRVDLITVHEDRADILDFKTGNPSDEHDRQVTRYGLLWMRDDSANPGSLPVGSLALAYPGGDREVEVPTDWQGVEDELRTQIERADGEIGQVPPPARPSDACWHCPVRHLCEEYWNSEFTSLDPSSSFGDADLIIESRNGPRSWIARSASQQERTQVLLRTSSEDMTFERGQRLRALNLGISQDDEEAWHTFSLTRWTELYPFAE